MRLLNLTIDNFKNLRDFSIDFNYESPTTVLIGRNGTGKSNLLEALILIFRDLDFGDSPTFKYRLSYFCRDHEVNIDADPQRSKNQVLVNVHRQSMTYQRFSHQSE